MKNDPMNEGVISENFSGIGPVSRKMVHQRASELAQSQHWQMEKKAFSSA